MMSASLGMARTAQQECFGDAFLLAVAGVAGCAASLRRPDDDSIDWTLSCRLSRRPKIDVQMKTWVGDDGSADPIRYPLKPKNYSDLILTDILAPRILVVVTIPKDINEWMVLSGEQIVLRRCAYWTSLSGQPQRDNESSVTVSVPRSNVMTVEALQGMMRRINEGGAL
ncbi:DUF4365 domain-containing protein [Mesorhizobium sp. M0959]|uniref:DUF4365 domain-containing protein n=1 Tax=Mesorhizobium sp. M0959 TaxID=2957034 RepID=UPI003335AE31